jgi:hypothetical protein
MNTGRLVVGAALVLIGALFFADAFEGMDAGSVVASWWPLAVIALGVVEIVAERQVGRGPLVLLGLGGLLLAGTTGVLGDRAWSIMWPAGLIALGLWLVLGRRRSGVTKRREIRRLAVLTGSRIKARSEAFRLADLTSLMGSIRLDLTKATVDPGGARVAATAVLGSIVVLVPDGWKVRVTGLPVFGGWDDTTSRVTRLDAPTVDVRVLAVFGGVEVRHPRLWN